MNKNAETLKMCYFLFTMYRWDYVKQKQMQAQCGFFVAL